MALVAGRPAPRAELALSLERALAYLARLVHGAPATDLQSLLDLVGVGYALRLSLRC